jgi:hypothetical protein
MPGLPCVGNDLLDFGRRDVPRIDPTNSPAFAMHLQHNLRCGFTIFIEVFLHDHHDKFHWREVVVQQHHLIHGRRLQLFFLPLQYGAVLLVRDNCHTPILNNSDRPAILSKPDRLAGDLVSPPHDGTACHACALHGADCGAGPPRMSLLLLLQCSWIEYRTTCRSKLSACATALGKTRDTPSLLPRKASRDAPGWGACTSLGPNPVSLAGAPTRRTACESIMRLFKTGRLRDRT